MPRIELIGASFLSEAEFKLDVSKGARPRLLHTRASAADDTTLTLSVQIQDRLWIDRANLPLIPRPIYGILDFPGDPAGRYKETFANWIARSYTRVELPDTFNFALDQSGIKKKILAKLKASEEKIHGVFFEVSRSIDLARNDENAASDDADNTVPMTPSEVAMATGPLRLGITVVVYENCSHGEIQDIRGILGEMNENRIPIDKLPEDQRSGRSHCSISDLAKNYGVEIEGYDVVRVSGWTVSHLMSNIRFTDYDYLSSADESGNA